MLSKVEQCGEDLCLLIPAAMAREHGLEAGSEVSLRLERGEFVITLPKQKRLDLDELLASVPESGLTEEWDIGPPVGREVW